MRPFVQLKTVFVFFVGVMIGLIWYRYWLPPMPQVKLIKDALLLHDGEFVPKNNGILIARYHIGMPWFSDRNYYDTIGAVELEGLRLIQAPRHFDGDIVIKSKYPLTAYRAFCETDAYHVAGYVDTPIKINVRGYTCTHKIVRKKDFPAGTMTFIHKRGISSTPVLLEVHEPSKREGAVELISLSYPVKPYIAGTVR
jgi:hypothetical protein